MMNDNQWYEMIQSKNKTALLGDLIKPKLKKKIKKLEKKTIINGCVDTLVSQLPGARRKELNILVKRCDDLKLRIDFHGGRYRLYDNNAFIVAQYDNYNDLNTGLETIENYNTAIA